MNQKIAKKMSGMTVAVGYPQICDTDEGPPLVLVTPQRFHVNADDYDVLGLAGRIDNVFLSPEIDRKVGNKSIGGPGDLVRLQSLYSYASLWRVFVAAHMIYALPTGLQKVMFGVRPLILRKEHLKQRKEHEVRPLFDAVNENCLNFLFGLRRSQLINRRQVEALITMTCQ